MTKAYNITHDPDVDAVYLTIDGSSVATTVEIDDLGYVDLDDAGRAIGIEFLSVEDFFAFMREHGGKIELSESLMLDVLNKS